ncbi:MAG: DUF177 domain-containing protein [Candidatus Limnocylindrales bacterium]|jgi:uncharacterized protein
MSSTNRRAANSRSAADALTFNVAGLLGEPLGSVRELDVSSPPLDLGPDIRQSRGVTGKMRLSRTNRGLLVQARLKTELDEGCSRCLREIDYPVEVELEEEALPSIDLMTGLPLDTSAEPDVLRLTDHHELVLEQAVREAILLAEPIAPLCRADCPGLCVVCGQELAAGKHDHPDEEVDPRLEALRRFRAPE